MFFTFHFWMNKNTHTTPKIGIEMHFFHFVLNKNWLKCTSIWLFFLSKIAGTQMHIISSYAKIGNF